jgi:hypothetical protein
MKRRIGRWQLLGDVTVLNLALTRIPSCSDWKERYYEESNAALIVGYERKTKERVTFKFNVTRSLDLNPATNDVTYLRLLPRPDDEWPLKFRW